MTLIEDAEQFLRMTAAGWKDPEVNELELIQSLIYEIKVASEEAADAALEEAEGEHKEEINGLCEKLLVILEKLDPVEARSCQDLESPIEHVITQLGAAVTRMRLNLDAPAPEESAEHYKRLLDAAIADRDAARRVSEQHAWELARVTSERDMHKATLDRIAELFPTRDVHNPKPRRGRPRKA